MRKIKVLNWNGKLYRLDDLSEGERLFYDLCQSSSEEDTMTTQEMTETEWADAEKPVQESA
jgi:hypothetical protein